MSYKLVAEAREDGKGLRPLKVDRKRNNKKQQRRAAKQFRKLMKGE